MTNRPSRFDQVGSEDYLKTKPWLDTGLQEPLWARPISHEASTLPALAKRRLALGIWSKTGPELPLYGALNLHPKPNREVLIVPSRCTHPHRLETTPPAEAGDEINKPLTPVSLKTRTLTDGLGAVACFGLSGVRF